MGLPSVEVKLPQTIKSEDEVAKYLNNQRNRLFSTISYLFTIVNKHYYKLQNKLLLQIIISYLSNGS